MSTAKDIVQTARNAGVELYIDAASGRVGFRYAKGRAAELAPVIAKIREAKADVLMVLQDEEARNAAIFLSGYLGKRVWTPKGSGRLVKVDQNFSTVEYEDGSRMQWRHPGVVPYA